MSKNNDEVFVCPYFKWRRGQHLGCEGGSRIAFPDSRAMKEYIGCHCGHLPGWEKCSVAAARNRYYDQAAG